MALFGKRRKHPLPKFPASVAPAFRSCCTVLNEAEIADLRRIAREHVEEIRKESERNTLIDLEGLRDLARVSELLLDHYPSASDDQKALIVGAVRYFAIAEDAFDEGTFSSGFHDDKCVCNHVLEELGLEDAYIHVD